VIRTLVLAALLAWPALVHAAGFEDPQDGALDASEWLLDRHGFLPIPIIITEPAVGYGAGVALGFFKESLRDVAERSKESGYRTPPDIYGIALAATENGTKIAGGGGMVSFDEGRWRYRGGVGLFDVNLDFYGSGSALDTGDRSIGYNLKGFGSSQQIMRRLGRDGNFVTARWVYADLEASFDPSKPHPSLPAKLREAHTSGLGLGYEYDSRDNIFTTSHGRNGSFEAVYYSPEIGSDNKFQTYRAFLFGYTPVAQTMVLGGRLDGRTARGDVPFYQLPYIDMRGIPAVRYQDQDVVVAELELRWNVTPRWALIGFAGTGRAWGKTTEFSDGEVARAVGGGFRYLIARRLGLSMGIDIARGPEDTAFYIQAGSSWR
jgi:hypothetical protein